MKDLIISDQIGPEGKVVDKIATYTRCVPHTETRSLTELLKMEEALIKQISILEEELEEIQQIILECDK